MLRFRVRCSGCGGGGSADVALCSRIEISKLKNSAVLLDVVEEESLRGRGAVQVYRTE